MQNVLDANLVPNDQTTNTKTDAEKYEYFVKNGAIVNIYYDNLVISKISKKLPGGRQEKLLSDIGGYLGFLIGASILTFAEFFANILKIFYVGSVRVIYEV